MYYRNDIRELFIDRYWSWESHFDLYFDKYVHNVQLFSSFLSKFNSCYNSISIKPNFGKGWHTYYCYFFHERYQNVVIVVIDINFATTFALLEGNL